MALEALAADDLVRVTGDVRDGASGAAMASRVYIQGADGTWYFPNQGQVGDVVRYERENYWDTTQVEKHATLSAAPFTVDLPAGDYTVTVERGKEYLPLEMKATIDQDHARWQLSLRRWTEMAAQGWYSGDMHCHRPLQDLGNLVLAEDLNVCFPLTYWTTTLERPPSDGDKTVADVPSAEPVAVDATHVWYPRNTEYEIFEVGKRKHTLGAFLILNHHTPFESPCLPLAAITAQVREERGVIDLEKHNWEWAAVVAPVLPVELFELANNHDWRIGFGVKNWGAPAARWMNLNGPSTIDNEQDWIEYGWQFYYALLNSGLAINPTAGSASGAHPVPLGYSRVYVHLPQGFSYDNWLAGLRAGRSFVTTGPMLLVTVNDRDAGEKFKPAGGDFSLQMRGEVRSAQPMDRIEIVWNGDVIRHIKPTNERAAGALVTRFDMTHAVDASGWLAVRCVGKPKGAGGIPFAHSAPWHVEIAGRPLRPRRREVQYFLQRVEEEIARNESILTREQLEDYYRARDFWREKLEQASN